MRYSPFNVPLLLNEIDAFLAFIEMLASMRTGVLEDWHKEEFQKLCRQIRYDDGISPTQLYVTRSPSMHRLYLLPV